MPITEGSSTLYTHRELAETARSLVEQLGFTQTEIAEHISRDRRARGDKNASVTQAAVSQALKSDPPNRNMMRLAAEIVDMLLPAGGGMDRDSTGSIEVYVRWGHDFDTEEEA